MKIIQKTQGLEFELLQGSVEIDIVEVCYNSKNVVEDSIFVCLKGARFDSHTIIDEVVKKGAKAIVIQEDCSYPEDVTVIRVKDTRKALALLSAARFSYPARKMVTIGVTGTKGKTTTTHMMKTLLEQSGKKVGMIGTNGCFIGSEKIPTVNTTPESYELHQDFQKMVDAGCQYMIMEVSSQGLKMHRTAGIEFDYAVFTNISLDHIGPNEHADFQEYLMCKSLLFSQCKTALVNLDDEHAPYIIEHAHCHRLYTFGSDEKSDFHFSNIQYVANKDFVGITFGVCGKESFENFDVHAAIPGRFNAYNALSAVSVCALLGLNKEILTRGLEHIHVDGRMEIAYKSDHCSVIVDYAHNAISMESLLDTLRNYHPKRLVVVFGCGGNRAKERRYAMGEIAGRKADLSIVTADNSRYEKTEDIIADIVETLKPTGGKYLTIPDRREAIFYAVKNAQDGDMIAVIGKGHEDYQEINGVRTHFRDREVVDEAVKELL